MSEDLAAVYVFTGGGAIATFFLATALTRKAPGRLRAANYRGVRLPVVLGTALWGSTLVVAVAAAVGGWPDSPGSWPAWAVPLGGSLVYLAGLVDDVVPAGPRGLRGHAAALLRGRPTTGALKVVAVLGAAIVVVAARPRGSLPEDVLAALLVAAGANLWNGLDVAPGRALKVFLLAGTAIAASMPLPGSPLLLAAVGSAAVALWFDLRERAMLGDAGANVLGFVVGALLYPELPGWGLAVAAAVVVALNLLAETFTLSRAIAAVPPLRWLDRLGRRPDPSPGPLSRQPRATADAPPGDGRDGAAPKISGP